MSGNSPKAYSLLQLNTSIQKVIDGIGKSIWITAEIASSQKRNGHVYLELVQKDHTQIVAKARAMIWASQLSVIKTDRGHDTDQLLSTGTKVMIKVTVTYHTVHGLSLQVYDIDPAYTVGELELKRRQTIERLQKEQLIDRQSYLRMPLVPQKIAVISSENASGYADFVNQLVNNAYGYHYQLTLFPVSVQGEKASKEIVSRIAEIDCNNFDIMVIIRGGGSKLDLQPFDEYDVAHAIAQLPLPVITGIGHHTDECVADMVAHTAVKTPTAAAELILRLASNFEAAMEEGYQQVSKLALQIILTQQDRINSISQRIGQLAKESVNKNKGELDQLFLSLKLNAKYLLDKKVEELNQIQHSVRLNAKHITEKQSEELTLLLQSFKQQTKYLFERKNEELNTLEWKIQTLDPLELMRKGYSITLLDGKPINAENTPKAGDKLKTIHHDFEIESTVDEVRDTNLAQAETEETWKKK
ncbi:exodeoxyribonuclease VII large subunit [Limibacter armeniacum]|uniref:exodeoxyribonuclease VII large subunit n=1 Tax=Limibacter armeniacum TaxID=466084 RepID=UPI002FE5A97B